MGHRTQIMYIEPKYGVASLNAWIGNVTFSKTGKTISYDGMKFQSLKGVGYKANYFEIESGTHYWISGCRKDGNDGLYAVTVHVDEDIRAEYWTSIRRLSDRKNQVSFKSRGKHRVGKQDLKNKVGNV